ncbi:MAG TPA: restriction endonuclease subunit S [Pseudoxanthomonas sp.]|nr:restriction endonuclease subunit S [Pseudoxanthomonas sp.]
MSVSRDWKLVFLESVAQIVNGGTPASGVPGYWNGDVQWLTPRDMGLMQSREIAQTPKTITQDGLRNSSARLVPETSVILSTRAPIGHLAINTRPMAFNQGCRGIVPGGRLDHQFLYYFLLASRSRLDSLGTGATFKELSAGALRSFQIPLPPLEEQKRIVAVLDQAFAALDRARANVEENMKAAEGLLQGALDASFEAIAMKSKPIELQDAVHPDCGLSYGIVQPGDEVDDGLPIVRPVDLTQREIGLAGLKRINPNAARGYTRTTLQGGELLLCVRGSTGTVSVASEELAGANVTRGIVPIRFDPSRVLRDFAYFQFRSCLVRSQIAEKTYGAALMQINIKDLRALRFLVPELDAQRELVQKSEAVLADTEALCRSYEAQLIDIAALRHSLLQAAFSGQLA